MSGIYFTVWDKLHFSGGEPLLQPTKGGWPHVTIVYVGKNSDWGCLTDVAYCTFSRALMDIPLLTLTRAFVNSWEKSPGVMRHDVLLAVDEVKLVEQWRDDAIKGLARWNIVVPPHSDDAPPPHVTIGIYDTLEAAQDKAVHANMRLPRTVQITGFTLD